MKPKIVLVTGASSGIGREIAKLLVERGLRVFGTARDPRRVVTIPGVEAIKLDVTDSTSVKEAIRLLLQKEGRIDALVNNAGYALIGALEETSFKETRDQFETNFFGVTSMVNAVIPIMRQQGSGRIINISSVVGIIPSPYMGIYSASKHALEGYSETLDYEVRQFGIRVSLVEPGFTKTNLAANGMMTDKTLSDYAVQRKGVLTAFQHQISNGTNPRLVAEAVYRALITESPRLYYRVGASTHLVIALKWLLPDEAFRWVIRRVFHVHQTTAMMHVFE